MSRLPKWLERGAAWLSRRRLQRRARRLCRARGAGAPTSDNVTLAFADLCRRLDRPFPVAEIRAAAPPAEHKVAVGGILLAAERLGFKARALKASRHNLQAAPPPFLVVGRTPGDAWLARAHIRDHLLLLEPGSSLSAACSLDAVADLAERIVLIKPLLEAAPQGGWRDTMLRRLHPVLWELGIAWWSSTFWRSRRRSS
jgi:ABC-type bacteriocin/lantibiotic exporter with double-glycine peptidase domain